jgi:hypothetical protein
MHRLRLLLALCACTLAFSACDSNDPTDEPDDEGLLDEAVANPGQWFFIEAEGLRCRDGSETGFGIRFQEGAENLVIYLEGGGACFNAATCATNPDSFTRADFEALVAQRGDAALFSPTADNPVGDWNAVYVPYCTGDVHGGSNPSQLVPNVGVFRFVGHMNVERVLDVVAPVVGDPGKVLLTGASAGGFGALVNFAQVADRFDASQPYLVDDSGPIFFADDVLSPALADGFNTLYNLEAAFPDGADALFESDGLEDVYAYYATRYPEATFGLSSYLEDATIRAFFGFGQPDQMITGPEYAAGLEGVRAMAPTWGTFYAPGADHTFLGVPDRYFGPDGATTTYADWLGDLLDGNARDVTVEGARVAAR